MGQVRISVTEPELVVSLGLGGGGNSSLMKPHSKIVIEKVKREVLLLLMSKLTVVQQMQEKIYEYSQLLGLESKFIDGS